MTFLQRETQEKLLSCWEIIIWQVCATFLIFPQLIITSNQKISFGFTVFCSFLNVHSTLFSLLPKSLGNYCMLLGVSQFIQSPRLQICILQPTHMLK